MGAACGSARDSTQPSKCPNQPKRHQDKKLTSLDDVLKIKQRRYSADPGHSM